MANDLQDLLIMPHLGLGDALICNGLVREIAPKHRKLGWVALHHNVPSLTDLWADLKHLIILGVASEEEGHRATKFIEQKGIDTLKLGLHAEQKPDLKIWDIEFYRQANVDPQARWKAWEIGRLPTQIVPPKKPFILVHDDPQRGFSIDTKKLPGGVKHLYTRSVESRNILEWLDVLQAARQVHCIDSCFAILADLVHTNATLILHDYARGWHPQSKPPSRFDKKWEHV